MAVPAVVEALTGAKAVVAKLGMDAHWRGAIVVANAFRDAGMEVVYIGHAEPATIARTAVDEDAILIGLSSLSGNHMSEVPRVFEALADAGMEDVAVVVGGTVPAEDAAALKRRGIDEVFPTGSSLEAILARTAELVGHYAERRAPSGN
jgi:methylmalonyl-CoA mutase C-terminal domain/subunit